MSNAPHFNFVEKAKLFMAYEALCNTETTTKVQDGLRKIVADHNAKTTLDVTPLTSPQRISAYASGYRANIAKQLDLAIDYAKKAIELKGFMPMPIKYEEVIDDEMMRAHLKTLQGMTCKGAFIKHLYDLEGLIDNALEMESLNCDIKDWNNHEQKKNDPDILHASMSSLLAAAAVIVILKSNNHKSKKPSDIRFVMSTFLIPSHAIHSRQVNSPSPFMKEAMKKFNALWNIKIKLWCRPQVFGDWLWIIYDGSEHSFLFEDNNGKALGQMHCAFIKAVTLLPNVMIFEAYAPIYMEVMLKDDGMTHLSIDGGYTKHLIRKGRISFDLCDDCGCVLELQKLFGGRFHFS
eukprot:773418_1